MGAARGARGPGRLDRSPGRGRVIGGVLGLWLLAAPRGTVSRTPQPGFLSAGRGVRGVRRGSRVLVNIVVVVALATGGAAFLNGRPRLIRPALIVFAVRCPADWVLVEDLGFLGGGRHTRRHDGNRGGYDRPQRHIGGGPTPTRCYKGPVGTGLMPQRAGLST